MTAAESTALTHASPSSPMALIQLAVENNADPDRLDRLMDLAERWQKNTAAEAFAEALAKFQAKCPPIHKGRNISMGSGRGGPTYASYDDIMLQIRPLLSECGLSVTFSTNLVDKHLHAICTVRKGAHIHESEVTLPVPDMKVNDTQKMGAAISYGKRYALCAALNIITTDQDVDAEGLGVQTVTEQQARGLQDLVDQLSTPQATSFIGWIKEQYKAESCWDIPADHYNTVRGFLNKKVSGK